MVAGPTWQCSDCDTYNDAAVRVCDVCETPRAAKTVPKKAAPKKAAPKKAAPKRPVPKKAAAAKKPAAAKKAAATRKPAATRKSAPAKRAPVTDLPATGGRRTPPGMRVDVTGTGSPTVPGLVWECPLCAHRVVGAMRCDRCGTRWSIAAKSLPEEALFGSAPVPVRTPPREATRGELVAGCGCLLFLAAAIITPIVLLILNWSAVTSFVTGSDSSKPSPAPSASGPCPKPMAEMLPEGSGARLVAAYSRDDLEERYAFCRTGSGKVFYFARMKDGEPYGDPTQARESEQGYVVDFRPQGTSYHFRDGEVTAYDEDGKEIWQGELVPEATVD
ncbi:hypothetical protein ABZY14_11260 [Streptomyces sp. NPDC006617]|uniref:hypothetical protein n=1 Tax=Streptomyces sp. NPDC006617 TaxID=3155354 RepID=UPI0033B8EA32